MGLYYDPPQDLLDGNVGTRIREGSGGTDIEKRWRFYKRLASGRHLYAVIDKHTTKVAICVDSLVEFEFATRTYRISGRSILYFKLSAEEHARSKDSGAA